jgi:hypothetical protein
MRARVVGLTVSLCLLSSALAHAQGLPSAKPGEVGLSSEQLKRAMAAVKADVESGEAGRGVSRVGRRIGLPRSRDRDRAAS